jgi:hypothetical protein
MPLFTTPLMASLGAEAPEVFGAASFSIVENTSTSTVLSTYVASGTTPITWSVTGTDAANFNINSSGKLTFANSPDYETVADRSQSINVVATNTVGSASQAVAVTVTNDASDDPHWFAIPFTNNVNDRRAPEHSTLTANSSYVMWVGDDSLQENGGRELQHVRINKNTGTGLQFYNAMPTTATTTYWTVLNGSYLYTFGRSSGGDRYFYRYSQSGGSQQTTYAKYYDQDNTGDRNDYAQYFNDTAIVYGGKVYGLDEGTGWAEINMSNGRTNAFFSQTYNHSLKGACVWGDYIIGVTGTSNLRFYRAPTAANISNGTAFNYVNSGSIANWPGTYSSELVSGIANDGSHLWIAKYATIAKYDLPQSAGGSIYPSP